MTDKEMAKLKMMVKIMLFLFYAMPVAWFREKLLRFVNFRIFFHFVLGYPCCWLLLKLHEKGYRQHV